MVNVNENFMCTIPLRGVVVFPGVTISIDLQRIKTKKTANIALENGKNIFFVTQKDPSVINPGKKDLFEIGTIAKIKQVIKLPHGVTRIFIEGLTRAKLVDFIERETEYTGVVTVLDDNSKVFISDIETEANFRVIDEITASLFNNSNKSTTDELERILNKTNDETKINSIIEFVRMPFANSQMLLEESDVKKRVEMLQEMINDEAAVRELKLKIESQVKVNLDKHQREFILREEMKVIQKELDSGDGILSEAEELIQKVEAANMPENVREKALKEIKRFEKVPASTPENSVIRNYIVWLTELPWSKESPVKIDIKKVKKSLDKDHFGLEKIKERIIEFLAVQKMKESMKSPILCLVGPPGVGKTSLAKSIATATGREYVRVSLGGVRDEAEIRGHRRTYIGAMPGRIIQGIKKAGTNNPVFLLDEIDKMASDFRGDPSSAMLEVLDPEQNNSFSDHFIEEPFDLSKVMFIATANNLNGIPGPLRDRMEIIQLSSYTEIEKFNIAKNHLINKQLREHGLEKSQLTIGSDPLKTIIRSYTREAGVRGLERKIGKVCRKATREILETEINKISVDKKKLQEYLGQPIYEFASSEKKDLVGVATGLAYTAVGGDTLQIEVALTPGKGKIQLTGKLGDVMKESAQTAMTYIKSNFEELKIDAKTLETVDIHIHVPEGAVPKDGPSAGITIATALASALTNRAVRKEVGMTGEITLRGRVLPIGGLKEKSISAHRSGLKTIICPKKNEKDLEDIPELIKEEMEFIFVSEASDVLKKALL